MLEVPLLTYIEPEMDTEISNPQSGIRNPESAIRNPQPHIFLVGFMACGKSTVGPVLATKLDRPFIDLDRLIEAKVGCTIAELIARDGEEWFRQVETETLRESAQGESAVIAPGGGAIMRAENRDLMARSGVTVWLDAPVELCWRRIRLGGAVRPLAPDEETVRARHQHRRPLYQQATLRISIVESQSPEEIAADVVDRLRVPSCPGWVGVKCHGMNFPSPKDEKSEVKMPAELEEPGTEREEEREMPSFNHSYICADILEQLYENKTIKALPELTLEIGKGLTPDISIYPKEKVAPNFLKDYLKYPEMPMLAIEVISATQNIQDLLEKAEVLIAHGIKTVWTIEPFTNTIFVTTGSGVKKFPSQEIESEGIRVDFKKIFR